MEEFTLPKTKKEFMSLQLDERNLLIFLLSKRVIQVVQELQSFGFSMSFNLGRYNSDTIDECFRVLSYTPMKASFQEVKEEYTKAKEIAYVKVKASKIAFISLCIAGTLVLFGFFEPLKILGG